MTPTPTAAALAAYQRLPWSGLALVVDVDGHALTWSAVSVEADHVQLVQTHVCPHLGPRGVAAAAAQRRGRPLRAPEPARPAPLGRRRATLYDQLADLLASGGPSAGMVELVIQAPQWFQNLMLHSDELAGFCVPLVRQAMAEMQAFTRRRRGRRHDGGDAGDGGGGRPARPDGGAGGAIASAGHRPRPQPGDGGDFGADLPLDDDVTATRVQVLDADAVARAACDLAGRVRRGELPRGRIDAAPLPSAAALGDGGPPRVQFRGQDHPLTRAVYTLGRDPACDMVFEAELYPSVSARHCEIALDRGAYLLRDRSRHGTLLNDHRVNQQAALHSGDWIRLGPGGPVLRFLGRPAEQQRRLMTTA